MNKKLHALAKFLEVNKVDLTKSTWDKNTFCLGNKEYLVLTDKQADKYTKDYILESLWAFNTNFIMDHAKKSFEGLEAYIKDIQINKCESANDFIKAVIKNKKEFIYNAIRCDGRGHFISSYDGNEHEFNGYYIYRIN